MSLTAIAGGRRTIQLSPAQIPAPQCSETSVLLEATELRDIDPSAFIGFPSAGCKLRCEELVFVSSISLGLAWYLALLRSLSIQAGMVSCSPLYLQFLGNKVSALLLTSKDSPISFTWSYLVLLNKGRGRIVTQSRTTWQGNLGMSSHFPQK